MMMKGVALKSTTDVEIEAEIVVNVGGVTRRRARPKDLLVLEELDRGC